MPLTISYARFVSWILDFIHRRIQQPQIMDFNGIRIQICPHVFNPISGRTTKFFIQNMIIPSSAQVLEIGTGTGAIAVAASQVANQVIATDISPYAVECARMTMRLNGVERNVTIQQGDLFDPVKGLRFGVILFNPPYLALEAKNQIHRAWCAGPQLELIRRFLTEAPNHLSKHGEVQILFSSAAPITQIVTMIRQVGFQIEVIAKGRLLSLLETIYLFRLR